MSLLGRQSFTTTDPITPIKFVEQYQLLKDGLDNRIITEENFYQDSHKKIKDFTDAVTNTKLFEGAFVYNQTESTACETYNLKLAIDKMTDMVYEDYLILSQPFEYELSTNGIKMKSRPLGADAIVSGIGTAASLAGAGALAGAQIGTIAGLPGAAVGAAVGGAIGLGTAITSWVAGPRKKKEVSQAVDEIGSIIVEAPFGFVYEDHSVTGHMECDLATGAKIFPYVHKLGSDSDLIRFVITTKNSSKFTSSQFFFFKGEIQILLRRKI